MSVMQKTIAFMQARYEQVVKVGGLGSVVAAVTAAVGIRPCGKCKDRQEILDKRFPLQSDITNTEQEKPDGHLQQP